MRLRVAIIFCFILTLFTFAQDSDYIKEITEWHEQRITRLKQPDGWLSLVGLFWLQEGENTFGADASNDIRFPKYKADDFMGSFFRDGKQVSIKINDDVEVTSAGEPVYEMELQADVSGEPTLLEHNSLRWYIIIRGERVGVRLKDVQSETVKNFAGIPTFPIDEKWKIKARLQQYDPPITIKIPDVLGDVSESPCPGALVFEYDGTQYRLHPSGTMDSPSYFLIFSDASSGDETYGAGRFLSIPHVDENGETVIDFNKAVNPPCAFTPYATCPLPPRGNHLPFKVLAGEKDLHAHP
jgi:uncharacterized protein (DUF1684 family)